MGEKNIFSLKSWARAQATDQPERVAGSQGLLGTAVMNSCLLVPCSRRDAKPNTRRHASREFQGLWAGTAKGGQGPAQEPPQDEAGSSFSRAFFCFSVAEAKASASFSEGIMLSTLRANRS